MDKQTDQESPKYAWRIDHLIFVAKAVWTTVGIDRTVAIGVALNVTGIFITVPIPFTISIRWAVPCIITRNVGPGVGRVWFNFYQATLNCEEEDDDDKFYGCFVHAVPCPRPL